ncbi:MAG: tetratricopeptide repeat protein, partial [Sphingobacteriales bacterium]
MPERLIGALFVLTLIAIAGCNSETKTKSAGYTALQWGEYLYYYNKMDSAFLKFNQAANNGGTALERGKAFNYMGMMQRNADDLYGAQESLTSALRTLDRNNPDHRELITYVYNELGNASLDLKRYDEAIIFYDSALQSTTEKPYILEILNGKATTLQKEKRYNEAIAIYDSILKLNPGNQVLVARAISN